MKKIFLKQGVFTERPSKDSSTLDLTQEFAKLLTAVGIYNSYDCCKGTAPTNGQSLIFDSTLGKYVSGAGGGGGLTNLGYSASPTNGIITNSNGTVATLPLVTGTNAGLATPAMFNALSSSTPTNAQIGVGNTYISVTDPANGTISFVIDGVTTMSLSPTKLSLNGILIDPPSGLELMLKSTNPGGIQANTLWLNSTTNHLMRGSLDLENISNKEIIDNLTPIGINIIPNLSLSPSDVTKVKIFVNGILENGISVTGNTLTVNPAILGYNIDTNDVIKVIYFI